MMTDVFVEYMVKKKTGSKDILMSLGVSILGAILIFVSIFLDAGFADDPVPRDLRRDLWRVLRHLLAQPGV